MIGLSLSTVTVPPTMGHLLAGAGAHEVHDYVQVLGRGAVAKKLLRRRRDLGRAWPPAGNCFHQP